MTARQRVSFAVMGTIASFVAHASAADFDHASARVRRILSAADHRFSPYRPDSELSLMRRGVVADADASPDMASVLRGCRLLETVTGGAFRPRTPAGALDTTGFAKGWAMARAGSEVRDLGISHWLLTVGGDVVASGGTTDRPWQVAVRHPDHPGTVSKIIALRDGAVATSGNYERGAHIWTGANHMAVRRGSCTVVGPRIEIADGLATACWSAGKSGIELVSRVPGYQVMYLDDAGMTTSPDFPRLVVNPNDVTSR